MNRRFVAINMMIFGAFVAAVATLLLVDPHVVSAIGMGFGPLTISLGLGLAFWTALTAIAAATQVEMPRGVKIAPILIPTLGAAFLGGPLAGAFVAYVGCTDKRELRGEVHWSAVLADHASIALGTLAAGVLYTYGFHPLLGATAIADFGGAFVAGFLGVSLNTALAAAIASARLGRSFIGVIGGFKDVFLAFCALIPFAWLFPLLYVGAGAWATLLAALPLYTVRTANQRFVEMRATFVQAITALASALDARDVYTAGHSHRMSEVAVDIARAMRLSDDEIEELEWAGILHDVGKIGVPDRVLLKQGRLDDEERAIIEGHPVIGALIVEPVTRLSPEVPLIRHHHERWDGRGYPDGLAGEAIPKLARILAVADSFDAMTAQRPYRMIPLTPAEAYAEILKCSGSQFDPAIVEAFGRTKWAKGEEDSRRFIDPRLADVSMVSGSARLIKGLNEAANAGVRKHPVVVEFVDPHGDQAAAHGHAGDAHAHPHDDPPTRTMQA